MLDVSYTSLEEGRNSIGLLGEFDASIKLAVLQHLHGNVGTARPLNLALNQSRGEVDQVKLPSQKRHGVKLS